MYSATDSAFLSFWETKNAPNVAATSSAKTTRASVLNSSAQGALSLPTTTATSAFCPASACVSASITRSSEMLSSRPISRAWRRAAFV